ncbi:MAG: hypothetical protein ACRBB6_14220 [Neptuniibacter sp.]
MKLVKDLYQDRVVYYWVKDEEALERVSPDLHCLVEAEEWWKNWMFASYQGEERRRSIHDRRTDREKRNHLELRLKVNRTAPMGRRVTDKGVSVDIDLATEKLEQLRLGYE